MQRQRTGPTPESSKVRLYTHSIKTPTWSKRINPVSIQQHGWTDSVTLVKDYMTARSFPIILMSLFCLEIPGRTKSECVRANCELWTCQCAMDVGNGEVIAPCRSDRSLARGMVMQRFQSITMKSIISSATMCYFLI